MFPFIKRLLCNRFLMNLLPVVLIGIFSYTYADVYEDSWLLLNFTVLPIYVVCLNRILALKKGDTAFLDHYLPSLVTVFSSFLVLKTSLAIRPTPFSYFCDVIYPTYTMLVFLTEAALTVAATYIFSLLAHRFLKPKNPTPPS